MTTATICDIFTVKLGRISASSAANINVSFSLLGKDAFVSTTTRTSIDQGLGPGDNAWRPGAKVRTTLSPGALGLDIDNT